MRYRDYVDPDYKDIRTSLKKAGMELIFKKLYDAKTIRNVAQELTPTYIRKVELEGTIDALDKKNDPLEKRIPDLYSESFTLELHFLFHHPAGEGVVRFGYTPTEGYRFLNAINSSEM